MRTRKEGADVPDPDKGGGKGGDGPSDIARQVIRERQKNLYGNDVTDDEGGNK